MQVHIETEYIKLDQLLKFAGIADTGAMAKNMILDGLVTVNGIPTAMRGKKVRPGDRVVVAIGEADMEIVVT